MHPAGRGTTGHGSRGQAAVLAGSEHPFQALCIAAASSPATARRNSSRSFETSIGYPFPDHGRAKIIEFTDQGWATVNLALSALGELEAEIADRLGEPAVRQLRGTLLQILDRPAYTRQRISRPPA